MRFDRRVLPDRRESPTPIWAPLRIGGMRTNARRAADRGRAFYVDRFSALMLAMIVTLLLACIADAAITICLVNAGHGELNPLMDVLLQRGVLTFFVGKYLLTAVGLVALLVFKNHFLFGTRFRVGYAIPVLLGVYTVLIAYQWHLIHYLTTAAAP